MILQTKFELGNMNPLGLWSKIYALALDILIVGAEHATYAMIMRKNGKTSAPNFSSQTKWYRTVRQNTNTKMYYRLTDTMA